MSNRTVFISYARVDMALATKLCRDLRDAGLDPWIDHERVLPGQIWEDAISEAIKNSRYFTALLSSTSVNRRGYVNSGIREALNVYRSFP